MRKPTFSVPTRRPAVFREIAAERVYPVSRDTTWPSAVCPMLSASVLCMGKVYTGIGFRNVSGGLEFLSYNLCQERRAQLSSEITAYSARLQTLTAECVCASDSILSCITTELACKEASRRADSEVISTVTVGNSDILSYPVSPASGRSKCCCLFYSVVDYLCYLKLDSAFVPSSCDCYVLNDPRNYFRLLLQCDFYDNVYCLFPATQFGGTLFKGICTRHGSRVVDLSPLYGQHPTLLAYTLSTLRCTIQDILKY